MLISLLDSNVCYWRKVLCANKWTLSFSLAFLLLCSFVVDFAEARSCAFVVNFYLTLLLFFTKSCSSTWGLEIANLVLPASITIQGKEVDLKHQWILIFLGTLCDRSVLCDFSFLTSYSFLAFWLSIFFMYPSELAHKVLVTGWKGLLILCENRAVQVWCHL